MRLTASGDYARVRERGRVQHGRLLRVAAAAAPDGAEQRFGIVVSKRVGCAVVRNRVRRRLREICRAYRATLAAGWWIVTTAKPAAADAAFAELRDEWLRLIDRLSILAGSRQ